MLWGVGQVRGLTILLFNTDVLITHLSSYLIIIKSLIPSVVTALYHDLTSADTNPPAWALSGRIWISLVMVMLAPLGFFRRLDSLRHTSYVALFAVGRRLRGNRS